MYPCVFWSQSMAMRFAVVITTFKPSLYNSSIILLRKKIVRTKLLKNLRK